MIKSLLHRIMALPIFYDSMQAFFGLHKKKKILQKIIKFEDGHQVVLDVGGGTGLYKDVWPSEYRYICLDSDPVKLLGFSQKYPSDYKVCADATQIALKSASVDYVFCSSMSHHIHENLLEKIIGDMNRVIKKNGTLVFIDAVNIPKSRLNRFLWSLDRGEYPHTYGLLQDIIGKYFNIRRIEKFSIFYDYILIVATKSSV